MIYGAGDTVDLNQQRGRQDKSEGRYQSELQVCPHLEEGQHGLGVTTRPVWGLDMSYNQDILLIIWKIAVPSPDYNWFYADFLLCCPLF